MSVKANNITSNVTNVNASTSAVPLFAQNTGAKQRIIVNDSASAKLYVKFGTGASITSFTVLVPAGGYYEFPSTNGTYAGPVEGIWDAAVGTARLTEYW